MIQLVYSQTAPNPVVALDLEFLVLNLARGMPLLNLTSIFMAEMFWIQNAIGKIATMEGVNLTIFSDAKCFTGTFCFLSYRTLGSKSSAVGAPLQI